MTMLLFAVVVRSEDIHSIHPTGYVTDLANVIAPDSKARLEALCTEVEQKTGAQIAVVTVHSIENESIENYAADLFKQLGVGHKGDDRGVLLLIAPDLHQYKVEVGYGLEPVITDGRAGDAGRAMVPQLRQNNFGGAIETATWQLANFIAADRGVTLSGQPPAPAAPEPDGNTAMSIGWLIFFLIIVFFMGRTLSRGGGLGWFILGMLFGGGGRRGGGWRGGGFGGYSGGDGGGFGGYSGGGGGFGGFGGGSSGGGGASGSW